MTEIQDLMRQLHPATYHENQPLSPEKKGEAYPNYFDPEAVQSELIYLPDVSGFEPQNNDLSTSLKTAGHFAVMTKVL